MRSAAGTAEIEFEFLLIVAVRLPIRNNAENRLRRVTVVWRQAHPPFSSSVKS